LDKCTTNFKTHVTGRSYSQYFNNLDASFAREKGHGLILLDVCAMQRFLGGSPAYGPKGMH
jgi:hypothetical protein